jgi:hypothetical protein
MSDRPPGPHCVAKLGRAWIDSGTLARTLSPRPGVSFPIERSPLFASIARLQTRLQDGDEILTRLAGAGFPDQSLQLASFVQALEKQIANFRGRPALRLTQSTETWIRGSDTVAEQGQEAPIRDPQTGRQLTAYDQGAYLAKTSGRSGSAVLPGWNKMDTIEEQALPARSIVLQGVAAAQSPGGAWAHGGTPLPGGSEQIFHAGQLSPDGRLLPPAERAILSASRPDGSRIHPRT